VRRRRQASKRILACHLLPAILAVRVAIGATLIGGSGTNLGDAASQFAVRFYCDEFDQSRLLGIKNNRV
jgi:hypothetical protein